MRRFLISAGALALLAATFMIARADVNYTQGTGTVIFDFICFTTKHCTAHVPINSAGTEIMTSANPGQVGAPAAAMADGWDATQGAKADAAYTGSGSASAIAILKGQYNALVGSLPAGGNNIGGVELIDSAGTNKLSISSGGGALTRQASPYPDTAVPYTASATGTTAATTATLAGAASVTTYICGLSIRANATAAATGNATVTGTITGTLNFTQWTAPNASGLGVTEQIFAPCVPASATNTSIAVVSAAPGTGGVVSVTAWGYKL